MPVAQALDSTRSFRMSFNTSSILCGSSSSHYLPYRYHFTQYCLPCCLVRTPVVSALASSCRVMQMEGCLVFLLNPLPLVSDFRLRLRPLRPDVSAAISGSEIPPLEYSYLSSGVFIHVQPTSICARRGMSPRLVAKTLGPCILVSSSSPGPVSSV